jgi:hypothetical protein
MIFLKGLLCFIPGYLILLILRAIVGFAFSGLPLYLSLLVRDQLGPLALGLGGFILIQKTFVFPATRDGIFLTACSFFSGFFAMFGAMDFLAAYGHWEASGLFVFPLLRMSAIVLVSLAAQYFYRWQGRAAAAYLGTGASLSFLLAFVAWLYELNFRGWSAILGALTFGGAAALFILRHPMALGKGLKVSRKS